MRKSKPAYTSALRGLGGIVFRMKCGGAQANQETAINKEDMCASLIERRTQECFSECDLSRLRLPARLCCLGCSGPAARPYMLHVCWPHSGWPGTFPLHGVSHFCAHCCWRSCASVACCGSIEYVVQHLGSTLIMVLGHEACGAVAAGA